MAATESSSYENVTAMTRKVSSASSRLAREQLVDRHQLLRLLGQHGAIEHPGERRQAVFVQALLEQRPALLVEALRQEAGLVALGDDVGIRVLRVAVLLGREQQFAAAELHFVHLRCARIAADHIVQRGQRLVGLARGLVGARKLVEHLVVARVVGIALEQAGVELDGFGALRVDGAGFAGHAIALAGFHVQIAQAAQRFGAQLRIGLLQFEEALVVLHRARLRCLDLLVGLDHHGTRGRARRWSSLSSWARRRRRRSRPRPQRRQ